jgi:phosphoglycolate phosphatase-like HAD superfamily hydrolase
MIRLAVFDLDGTLVDSRQDLANAANALVQEMGGTPLPDDVIAGMVGEGAALLVRRVLAAAGLARFFRDVIGGDTAFGRKPEPAGLRELARRAGAPLAATVLIGDSPIDLQTARRGGCQAVLVRYGFGYRGDELRDGERVVAAPAEIPAAMR